MNILLIGLGSIGTRHVTNLLSLGYKKISIVSRKEQLPGASFQNAYVLKI
jgi:saccharopine dehydrogenase-like NADP-dependent oxidoreductase